MRLLEKLLARNPSNMGVIYSYLHHNGSIFIVFGMHHNEWIAETPAHTSG